jgi:hypothetical protein
MTAWPQSRSTDRSCRDRCLQSRRSALIVVDTNVLAYLLLLETKTNLAETLLLDPPAG